MEKPERKEIIDKSYSVELDPMSGPGGGLGSISITERQEGMELGDEALKNLAERLAAGEYIIELESGDIGQCGDGRPGDFQVAKMFGGTPALARDDAVSGNERFFEGGVVASQEKMYGWRATNGKRSYAHGDDHSPCGCGECAKADLAARFEIEHPHELFKLTNDYFHKTGLGRADRDAFKANVDTTRQLLEDGFYEPGEKQLEAFKNSGFTDKEKFETVRGEHKEAAWIVLINETDTPITLDRDAIARDFEGENLQAFVENHTEIMRELEDMAVSDDAKNRLIHANVARRLATAGVLTDLSLEIMFMKVK